MRARRFTALAAALLTSLAASSALSQEGDEAGAPGTSERVPEQEQGGWKGLPGAKDPGEPGGAPGWVEVDLKPTPFEKDLAFRTPRDSIKASATNVGAWVDVSNGALPLTGVKGGPVRFQLVGGKNMLDADGDGSYETAVQSELTSVRARQPDGSEAPYWFRLRRDDKRYLFNRAFLAGAKIDGTPVAFLDEDNDGALGEPLEDAVRIGGAPVAQYASDVLNIQGKLFCVRTSRSGTKLWYKPFEGPTGKVDVRSKYEGKSKPLFVMLRQGDVIVDAAAQKETLVPAGSWTVHEGLVGPGMAQSARIRGGGMAPIDVKAEGTTTVAWGMPGKIDFSVTKNGNQLVISGGSIKIYGKAGEEYQDFRPRKFTPNVRAVEDKSGRDVYGGNMGAGC
jgi:hypothetical protein